MVVDLGHQLPDRFKVFAVTLSHLNDAVDVCFDQEAPDDHEVYKFKEFKRTYLELGISGPPITMSCAIMCLTS